MHADFGFPIQKFRRQGQQATHSIESSSRSDAPGVAVGAIRHDLWKPRHTLHSTLLSSTASTALYGSTVGTFCFPKILRRLYGYTRLHDKTTLQISTVELLRFRRFYDGSAELYISTGAAEFSSRV
jgi:hypothetical protein